jgi:hypothetical protein
MSSGRRLGSGSPSGGTENHPLANEVEHLPTGREHLQSRADCQELAHPRRGSYHLLEVV